MSQTQTPKQRNLSYGGSMDPVYRLIVPPFCPVYRCLSGPIGRAHGMMSAYSVPFRSSLYENDVHRHVKNNRRRNVTSGHNVRSRHEQCGQGKAGIGEGMIWKSETHLKIMSLNFYSIRYAWCGKKEYQRSYKKTTFILFSAMTSRCWIRASLFETGLGKYVKYTYQFNAALKKIAFQSNSNITPSGSWTRVVLTNVNLSIYNTYVSCLAY